MMVALTDHVQPIEKLSRCGINYIVFNLYWTRSSDSVKQRPRLSFQYILQHSGVSFS